VGARTGRERTVLIARFPDGEGRWLVVGSFAGAAKHPAWLINLARNPDRVWAQIDRDRFKVRPDVLRGDERLAAWERIIAKGPTYANYQRQTDREIPVVRLTRETPGAHPAPASR
jgi:deazaflavin-dependent oxidoreductase (nitroreductase family)